MWSIHSASTLHDELGFMDAGRSEEDHTIDYSTTRVHHSSGPRTQKSSADCFVNSGCICGGVGLQNILRD